VFLLTQSLIFCFLCFVIILCIVHNKYMHWLF
jgi:hypothetical protein